MLIVFIASFIFWNVWSLIDYPLQISDTEDANQVNTPVSAPALPLTQLLKNPLFGVYVPDEESNNIKASRLDIKIVGVVVSEFAADSHVLIELTDGEQKIFSTGDTLPGDAQIKKITNSGLLIWYNNRLERITFPNDDLNFTVQEKPLQQETY